MTLGHICSTMRVNLTLATNYSAAGSFMRLSSGVLSTYINLHSVIASLPIAPFIAPSPPSWYRWRYMLISMENITVACCPQHKKHKIIFLHIQKCPTQSMNERWNALGWKFKIIIRFWCPFYQYRSECWCEHRFHKYELLAISYYELVIKYIKEKFN